MSTPSLPERELEPSGNYVSAAFFVNLVLSPNESVPLPARFVYDKRHPFSVTLEFPQPDSDGVTRWVFARELLEQGLRHPAGEGDVRIWPSCRCSGRKDVRMLLRGSTDAVLVDVPHNPLQDWMEQTWEAVPSGEENVVIDWETVTRKMLSW